ncbi:NYN domain protein [bacterium BMS3Abin02]|nr:NYN domain protein [bacterium BMS3Abin02]GBE22992.1 NYN domain protein [bacterium BMS3Bbin01]HDH26666.1 NYN domain-containing protein [Actinomycetota bacterium]HDL50110.1 NYN domain-containing protein [Actinomycetota bacterium]
MAVEEERIALFLDYENLAIGARDIGLQFDFKPIADALAERGRVVVRKAYAEWSAFPDDRRMLTRHNVELTEIPQRLGAVRKNAADIKMAVDAIELAFERGYLTTFVLGTGDSDFTPLVHKLRSLNKQVIGVGVKGSTSALLPPACDEFLFYERLKGVEEPRTRRKSVAREEKPTETGTETEPEPETGENGSIEDLVTLITQTLAGLQSTSGGAVVASSLKRAILRKDPTFSESDFGFRGFGELLRHLESRSVIELGEGPAKGDPVVSFTTEGKGEEKAFGLLRQVVLELEAGGSPPLLSGLKNQLRKRSPGFSEKRYGFSGFLQFCKAARTRGIIDLHWDDDAGDYVVNSQ